MLPTPAGSAPGAWIAIARERAGDAKAAATISGLRSAARPSGPGAAARMARWGSARKSPPLRARLAPARAARGGTSALVPKLSWLL